MRVRAFPDVRASPSDLPLNTGSMRSFHDVGALRPFSLRSFAFDMKMRCSC